MESKTTTSTKDTSTKKSWGAKEWKEFLLKAGLDDKCASQYGEMLESADIDESLLSDLDKECLGDVGITSIGHQLKILKHAKAYKSSSSSLKQPSEIIERGMYKSPFFTSLSVDSPLNNKNFKYHRQWALQGGFGSSTSEILLRVTEEEKSQLKRVFEGSIKKKSSSQQQDSKVEEGPGTRHSAPVNLLGGPTIWDMLGFQQ